MTFQSCLIDAIDVVLAWDFPDELLAETVTVQAALMARIAPDDLQVHFAD